MTTPQTAKRDVWTFLALLALLSSAFYALALFVPGGRAQWANLAFGFMWCPGLAALLTTVVRERSVRGFGWGLGPPRYLAIAYGLAIAACLAPYVAVWLAFDAFVPRQFLATMDRAGVPSATLGPAGLIAIVLFVAPLTGLLSTAGEEIGWRGFLVPRMHALVGSAATSVLVGLIWAAWHYPINVLVFPLHRPDVPLWYANACFTVLVIGASFVHTWLRLRSGSVWPSVLFHAAGNAFQAALQAATRETPVTAYVTTEYGAAFAVVGGLLVVLFWPRRM